MRKQVFAWATDHWQLATDESFIYNGWEVIEVVDALAGAAGELLTQYTWGLDLSGGLQGAGGIGGLLASEWPQTVGESKKYWFFYDANGNVGQLLRYRTAGGDSITPAARYEYDPYGNTLAAVDMDAQSDPGAAAANPSRFSTKWLDHKTATANPAGAVATTGLYYYGYRYYSSALGRWISRDPIGEDGGENLYRIVSNQVPNDTDPLGLSRRRSSPGYFDSIGWDIFSRWMWGDGTPYVLDRDPQYTAYMMANRLLPPQLQTQLIADARGRLTGGREGTVSMTFSATIENGYTTGYEMLHGTNMMAGGFQIHGPAPKLESREGHCVFRYEHLEYAWHDIIDPNPKTYKKDGELAARLSYFGSCKDYRIHIKWESGQVCTITLTGAGEFVGATGYPFQN